ncbi:MAG: AmmeMemoRadiSam system protein A [Pelolinea sp.]|nr:AmmeMemoRadiSam system protein A [Pelolinea sp.]
MTDILSDTDKKELLKIAREAIIAAVNRQPLNKIELNGLSKNLQVDGACFVTLMINGRLRGCIGALEAYQPLALDVQEHVVAAALDDYRFPPVSADEVHLLNIEISWLTPTRWMDYSDSKDLMSKLRPGIDGVLIKDGTRRATFLPQVWDQISNREEFLSHLCTKMGARSNLWRQKHLEVFTYQVEEFKEG